MDAFTDLLVEIGTEELPPAALPSLSSAFLDGMRDQLAAHGIAFDGIEPFATPRRLALVVGGVATRQSDQETVRRGPSLQAAFGADGTPTQAALGFARSCGVGVEGLSRDHSEKGGWLAFRSTRRGEPTSQLLPAMVEAALGALPIPKRMRWGTGEEEFVRPIHWVCLMLGEDPVPGRVLGVPCGSTTRGHRFHHPDAIEISSPGSYADELRNRGFVEPSFERRRERILGQVEGLAREQGLHPSIRPWLLDEVTSLVEWPVAILAHFDSGFLGVPPEVLIETMQKNQKYFPLTDSRGALQASFVVICNIESRDPDQVRAGNERVIRPRFADAKFFWEQDLNTPLDRFADRLASVVFQERLGTLSDKSARVERLGRELAQRLGMDADRVGRAARIAKCDLLSAMVVEFPGLQGTMGRYYAEHAGEDPAVCAAIEEQYLPRFAGDKLPEVDCGRILGIAERLDTLVGIFGIGLRPTGTKDPYGLRRASIAVLRMLIEVPLSLDLREALGYAAAGFPEGLLSADAVDSVLDYMLDRLRSYYVDRGVAPDTVEAVVSTGITVLSDLDRRVTAVSEFRKLGASEALAAANKRIRNILMKADIAPDSSLRSDRSLMRDEAEIRLAERMDELADVIAPLRAEQDYVGILGTLAGLRDEVDAFFDEVLVMDEDPALRENRIRILQTLHRMFLDVADISRLQ